MCCGYVSAVLSVDVMDASGTAESDVGFAKDMAVHKVRLDAQGHRIGKREYVTPQVSCRTVHYSTV